MNEPVPSEHRRTRRSDRQSGQSAVLLVMVVALLAAATMSGLGRLGVVARDRVRAQSAADAAALASLDGGRGRAAVVAGANGGTLLSWSVGPGSAEITVVVRVGSVSARARASDVPEPTVAP